MRDPDMIFISSSEPEEHAAFSSFPLERLDLYRHLVFPRMVYYEDGFRSHLDMVNRFCHGTFFDAADFQTRRKLLNIWNLPLYSGIYLAGLLERRGIRCAVINNLNAELDRFRDLYETSGNPPVVGLSATFHLGWGALQRVTKKLRGIDADMNIIAGGAMFPSLAMSESPAEWEVAVRKVGLSAVFFAMNSEFDLEQYMTSGKSDAELAKIPNLAWIASDGAYRVNGEQWHNPPLRDVPSLPTPAELPFVGKTIQIRTVVGCPFSCAFCSYPVMSRGLHQVGIDSLEKQFEEFRAFADLRQVFILDDTANVPKERFHKLCRLLGQGGWNWFAFIRPQFVDADTAGMMRDSGCLAVYMGVESGSAPILKRMNKRTTPGEMRKGISFLRHAGIATAAAFILGFPGETAETVEETRSFIEESGLDYYMLKEFFYIPSTGADRMREEFGLSGSGSKWSHATMNSIEASRIKAELFRQIRRAVHLDPDLGTWHLAAMTDAGFSMDETSAIQKAINAVVVQQMDGNLDGGSPAIQVLKNQVHLATSRMAAAGFR